MMSASTHLFNSKAAQLNYNSMICSSSARAFSYIPRSLDVFPLNSTSSVSLKRVTNKCMKEKEIF